MCRYRFNKSTTDNFNITKCTAIKHNNFFLLLSIMLHISILLKDHHQAQKYISNTHVYMQAEYYKFTSPQIHNLVFNFV